MKMIYYLLRSKERGRVRVIRDVHVFNGIIRAGQELKFFTSIGWGGVSISGFLFRNCDNVEVFYGPWPKGRTYRNGIRFYPHQQNPSRPSGEVSYRLFGIADSEFLEE
jgi:hypothetical protein